MSVRSPFPKSTYAQNAEVYKILANPKRLEILNTIKKHEARVDDLVKVVGISKANMSQQLSLLRRAGVVKARKDGLHVYYRITDPGIVTPCQILHDLRRRNRLFSIAVI
jgi:DNA-binding transcriptional ArsR family regulator